MNFLDRSTTTPSLVQGKIMLQIYTILQLPILLPKYVGNPQLEMNYEIGSAFSTPSKTKDKQATEFRRNE